MHLNNKALIQVILPCILAWLIIFIGISNTYQMEKKLGWPERQIVPFDCDAFPYIDRVANPTQGRKTFLDCRDGREENWASVIPLTAYVLEEIGVSKIIKTKDGNNIDKDRSAELCTLLSTPILLLLLTPILIFLLYKITNSYFVCWAVPFSLCIPGPFYAWLPSHPGHRGLLPYLIILLAVLSISANFKKGEEKINNPKILGSLLGIAMSLLLWVSTLPCIPISLMAIGIVTLGFLTNPKTTSYHLKYFSFFSLSIVVGTTFFHYLDYSTLKLHIENIHPFIGIALSGASTLGLSTIFIRKRMYRESMLCMIIAMILISPLLFVVAVKNYNAFSLLDPLWNTMTKQIVELKETPIKELITENIFLWILCITALFARTSPNLPTKDTIIKKLPLIFSIICTVYLLKSHYRFNMVATPFLAVIALYSLKAAPIEEKKLTYALMVAQICAGIFGLLQPCLPTEHVVAMRRIAEEIRKTDSRSGLNIIGPIDSSIALAYYLGGNSSTKGALFWESLPEVKKRDKFLYSSPNEAKKIAIKENINYVIAYNNQPDPIALSEANMEINKNIYTQGESLTEKLYSNEPLDWITPLFKTKDYTIYSVNIEK